MERIYVDHAATAPMYPEVIEKMTLVMKDYFGNPSSIHFFGREARHILDAGREVLAKSIGANRNEIIFTSGGTEADNLAILGVVEAYMGSGKHIITTAIEHHAVLHTCRELEKKGYDVTYLAVDEYGMISIDDFKTALREDTILVTIMYGNNEVGSIQPIQEMGQILSNHQAKFHTDAVQAYGLERIDVKELGIDLLSVSAHKINGPNGIGFLYANQDVKLSPRTFGGEHERKRRAGTENIAAVAGFAEAAKISQINMEEKVDFYKDLKRLMIKALENSGIQFHQNGLLDNTLPHVLNLSFPGTDVEAMLVNLDLAGIAASSGSACTAGSINPSHVLVAMYGSDSERIRNSIRFSFGLYNTKEQIETVAAKTAEIVKRLTKS